MAQVTAPKGNSAAPTESAYSRPERNLNEGGPFSAISPAAQVGLEASVAQGQANTAKADAKRAKLPDYSNGADWSSYDAQSGLGSPDARMGVLNGKKALGKADAQTLAFAEQNATRPEEASSAAQFSMVAAHEAQSLKK